MFHYNTSGNFVNGYHFINWVHDVPSGRIRFEVVGGYNLEQKQVLINKSIVWYNDNNTVSEHLTFNSLQYIVIQMCV